MKSDTSIGSLETYDRDFLRDIERDKVRASADRFATLRWRKRRLVVGKAILQSLKSWAFSTSSFWSALANGVSLQEGKGVFLVIIVELEGGRDHS